jgi:hypothetical protein
VVDIGLKNQTIQQSGVVSKNLSNPTETNEVGKMFIHKAFGTDYQIPLVGSWTLFSKGDLKVGSRNYDSIESPRIFRYGPYHSIGVTSLVAVAVSILIKENHYFYNQVSTDI